MIGSGPKAGEEFDVTVPSHVSALVQYESGQSAQAMFSFDSALPRTLLEVNGTEATMLSPDPNYFDGKIAVRKRGAEDWETVATTTALSSRGTGVLDMARAIRQGKPHRAQGAMGYHVLDTMIAIAESVESRAFVEVESSVDKPPLLPEDWDPLGRTIEGPRLLAHRALNPPSDDDGDGSECAMREQAHIPACERRKARRRRRNGGGAFPRGLRRRIQRCAAGLSAAAGARAAEEKAAPSDAARRPMSCVNVRRKHPSGEGRPERRRADELAEFPASYEGWFHHIPEAYPVWAPMHSLR